MSLDYLIVYQSDKEKIRIGSNMDGGYVIVNGMQYDSMISCGIANDINFEKEFCLKYPGIKCIAYDGTIDKLIYLELKRLLLINYLLRKIYLFL